MARLESGLEGILILGLDFLTSSKSEISIKRLNCSERERYILYKSENKE